MVTLDVSSWTKNRTDEGKSDMLKKEKTYKMATRIRELTLYIAASYAMGLFTREIF